MKETIQPTGWAGVARRIHPSGRNLQCSCGKWCATLFTLESQPDKLLCPDCVREARKQGSEAGRE